MREIKFRVWDKWTKQMLPVLSIDFKRNYSTERGRQIIMQCTGLKDNSGKEIYEGDIIRYSYVLCQNVGIVKFGVYEQDGSGGEYEGIKCLGFYIERIKAIPEEGNSVYAPWYKETTSLLDSGIETEEVVGNIYKNPELLECKDDV